MLTSLLGCFVTDEGFALEICGAIKAAAPAAVAVFRNDRLLDLVMIYILNVFCESQIYIK